MSVVRSIPLGCAATWRQNPPSPACAATSREPARIYLEGVIAVHDLHVWSLTAERIALSAHVVIGGLESWPEILLRLQALLATGQIKQL